MASRRHARLETLNRLTLAQWRAVIEAGPFDAGVDRGAVGLRGRALKEYPEVSDSLIDGVEPRDLVNARIEIWLRVRQR
jgi:hypothetical protein